HVTATTDSDVVREKLHWKDFQNRQQRFRSRRDVDHVVGRFFNFLVAFGRQRDHYAGAGFHLFQVGERLFVAYAGARVVEITGGDNYNRKILVDERVRPMLYFTPSLACSAVTAPGVAPDTGL